MARQHKVRRKQRRQAPAVRRPAVTKAEVERAGGAAEQGFVRGPTEPDHDLPGVTAPEGREVNRAAAKTVSDAIATKARERADVAGVDEPGATRRDPG